MAIHWYLVSDRSGARIFEQEGVKPELRLITRFENPDGKLKTSELVSDRQGRSDSSNTVGHSAVGNHNTPREHVLESFVRELSKFLEKEAIRNTFESLVLVAEPHSLGLLKKALGKVTSNKMHQGVTKDLVHISDHDMATHLIDVLCRCEEIKTSA